MGKPKTPTERLAQLQGIMDGLDDEIYYGSPVESAQAMREYGKIKNQYDQLYTEIYGRSPYCDQDGFDPFNPPSSDKTYNEFGGKRQGAPDEKPATGAFTQLGKVDKVKAINKGRKVFTQEYHDAMMRVIDVGGPMPK